MSPFPLFVSRRGRIGALCLALFLAACGGSGGVDSGGTGAAPQSFANGPISGFGSVIVAGVHFDDSSAQIRDADGNAHDRSELRLGMTVAIRGSAIRPDADGNDSATASSIVLTSAIVGPLAVNDAAGRMLRIFGETVDIQATTAFDDSLAGGQAALVPGDIVQVYANLDAATGHYLATRVERKGPATPFALQGVVSALDTGARTFTLGATRVAYAALGPQAALADGVLVRVGLATSPSAGPLWTAVRIGDAAPPVEDHEEAKVEGLVSAFASATRFSVDGTPVDATAAAFPQGSAGLALGARVKVEGSTLGGTLVATRVELVSDAEENGKEFDVRGPIDSIDTTARTFVVRSVIVGYGGTVDFRKGTAADLAVGRQVEARGTLSSDGTRVQATRIDFED